MSTEADIVMNFEASAAVGAVICSLGGTPVNANHIEYWKAQATEARQQSVGLAAKIIEMQAEITNLRAERDATAQEEAWIVTQSGLAVSMWLTEIAATKVLDSYKRSTKGKGNWAVERVAVIRTLPTSVIATDRTDAT